MHLLTLGHGTMSAEESVLRIAGLPATELVELVTEVSIIVVPIRQAARARNPDDNRVLDAAAAGAVDVIISGDADLEKGR